MRQDRRISLWIGYLATVAIELVITRLLIAVHEFVPLGQYPIYYVLVIMLVAYVFGEGPAILAFLLGLFAFDYFFVPPLHTPLPHPETVAGWASLIAYLLGTMIVGFATVMIRRSNRRLQRTADKLRESQEDLNRAQTVAHTGSWRLDVRRDKLLWSDETHRIFGVPEGTPLTYEAFLACVHPDDREYVDQKWTAAMSGELYDIEHRIVADGAVRWVRETAELEFDEQGQLLGGFGTARDVTDRKQAEEALETARKAAEYGKSRLEAVLEALPVGMSITDAKGGVIMVNRAYEQVWGGPRPITRSVEDYVKYKAWWAETGKLLAPEEWASAQAVQKGKAVVGQLLEIERFDGSHAFVLNSASPIRDASGNIVGSAVAIQDITEHRRTEEALEEEQEHKLEFYRRTIQAATEGKLVIAEPSEIEKIAGASEASWEIRNADDIGAIRHGVEAISKSVLMDEARLGQLVVAVGEAATNAFKHAGQGEASIHKTQDSLIVVISDRGPGIPALALPHVALTPGYSTAGTLGMGYKLMISFADKVYLATGAEGTTVGIEMRIGS